VNGSRERNRPERDPRRKGGGDGARLGPATREMRYAGLALALVVGGAFWLGGGCSETVPSAPSDRETNVLIARYETAEEFETGVIELDGVRVDREWGSEFSVNREFKHIRLSADEGAGDPGPPRYISMKAIYTRDFQPESEAYRLYMLLQWADQMPNSLKDVFVYLGPSLGAPIVRCATVGGELVCDSLYRQGDEDSLLVPSWWAQYGDDDKVALAFEIVPTEGNGCSFEDVGCQVACHGGGQFGALGSGRLDVWYWLAGRTNPIRDIFNRYDPDKTNPVQGIPGYLDDLFIDEIGGLTPDAGSAGYAPNFIVETGIPRHIYRRADDPFVDPDDPDENFNSWGEDGRGNNGVSYAYLWRENPQREYLELLPSDTRNESINPDPRPWQTYDVAPGYVLTYPTGSRRDIRGKANYDNDTGVWTLELTRLCDTEHFDPERQDQSEDVFFDPELGVGYPFTIALFDASTGIHWGSETQILMFETPREEGE